MLNLDELSIIFQFIPLPGLVDYRIVSTLWNFTITNNNLLWKNLCNIYMRNDLFKFDLEDEILDELKEEEHQSIDSNQFYYRLFRKLFFFPKIKSVLTENISPTLDEVKIMSLPKDFERFFSENQYFGKVSRFGFIGMLISCLSGKKARNLDYLNDMIKIGKADGDRFIEIPLCSLFALIQHSMTSKLYTFCGDSKSSDLFIYTPRTLPRSERYSTFCDLWYALDDKQILNDYNNYFLEWDMDDDVEIFPYALNVDYYLFKKVKFRIEFLTSDWKEMKLKVYWFDH
ncbi:hypothetical protein ABK040_008139 [Willaertia magna]